MVNVKTIRKTWFRSSILTTTILISSILASALLPFSVISIERPYSKAAERTQIDVFDSAKQTVIGTLDNTDEIQNQLQKAFMETQKLSPVANIPFNNKEIVYRIPIQPPIISGNRHLIEAFVVKMTSKETVLVSFDNHDKSMIYRFPTVIPLLHTLEKQSLKQ